MLVDAGTDRKDVTVEYDVCRRDSGFCQQSIGPAADCDLAVVCGCLALFVESHDYHRSSETVDLLRFPEEGFLSLLQGDGVDYAFSLGILQASQNCLPVGGVDHQGGLRHCRIVGDIAQEFLHLDCRIQHRVVHVYVYYSGSVLYLVGCDLQGGLIISGCDQFCEFPRAGDVGALSDIGEIVAAVDQIWLQTAYFQALGRLRYGMSLSCGENGIPDGPYMVGSCTAAASDYIDLAGHLPDMLGHLLRTLVVAAHLVRQAGIRVTDDRHVAEGGHFAYERQQFIRSERAVEAESGEREVTDRSIVGFHGLAGKGSAAAVADRYRDYGTHGVGDLLEGVEDGFCVEGVETCLYQNDVDAAFYEILELLSVCLGHVVETVWPEAGIADIRSERQRLGCRSDAAGDIDLTGRVFGHGFVRRRPGDLSSAKGHLSGEPDAVVLGLRDPVGAEGVGLDYVGSCAYVFFVDFGDDFRTGEIEAFVVAFEVFGYADERSSMEVFFSQVEPLNHCAHGPVQNQGAIPEYVKSVPFHKVPRKIKK